MLAKLIAFFIGAPSVDAVMSGFSKTLAKLRAVEAHHSTVAEEKAQLILDAQAAKRDAEQEAVRAAAVAKRLLSLVDGDTVQPLKNAA